MAEKFRILAADKLAAEGLAWIEQQPDAELTDKAGITENELAEIAGDYDAMIVRSGVQVSAKVLANPGRLKVVARAGVGVDNIDIDTATRQGILVVNSAEASTITTAEHAFALMITMLRNIGPAYKTMSEGGWDRNKFKGRQLAGKMLGVVGFGRIGCTLAERALAFGMNVMAYDPFINAQTMLDGKVKMFTDFSEMLPHVDILSFHVPLNDATRGMLNKETFELCRGGVYVVNASRGGVVDEDDLVAALDSGKAAGAAMDVFTKEPPAENHPLRRHPKALVTPHLGASTAEAQVAVSVDAAASALAYLRGEGISGAINAGGVRVDLDPTQQCYVDLARRMALLICPMITRGIAHIDVTLTSKQLTPAVGTIERTILVELLSRQLDTPVNVISVGSIAKQRGITISTTTSEPEQSQGTKLTVDIHGPQGAVDDQTHEKDRTRRIVGRVLSDQRPRIVEINGYHMDLVPSGRMLIQQNTDTPGVIGQVGTILGDADINISDMSVSHRDQTSLMLLRVEQEVPESVVQTLLAQEPILKICTVELPPELSPEVRQ